MPSEHPAHGPRLARQAQRSINRAEILDARTRAGLVALDQPGTPPPPRDSGMVLDGAGGLRVCDLWQFLESQLLSRHLDLVARVLPEFDSSQIHGRDFQRQNKGMRREPEEAVYLGVQASFRTGGGLGIFKDCKCLSASGEGSVTCQTVPLGLDN